MPDTIEHPNARVWPEGGAARIPYWVYQDPAVYAEELARIFYGPVWNYVGFEAEVPEIGDFRRNCIGEREVLMIRNRAGGISVVQNRCAHRGSQICQALSGNAGQTRMCPYHQWTYDLDGTLSGVPFRRGVKGKGGMAEDFDPARHNLIRLRVETLNGVVFASFDDSVQPLAAYLGPDMLHYFTRVFDGRGLVVLGYQRQIIDSNWKLQMENLKDSYHAGLLHLFLVSFGLFRLDQKAIFVLDQTKGHSTLATHRAAPDDHGGTEEVIRFDPDYKLADERLIVPRKEFPDDVTLTIQTIFPSIIVQAQSNTLATRHVIPKCTGKHELIWTFFGYEDDDEDMRTRRVRQSNLMGAAGYVTLDDAEALEFSQIGVDGAAPEHTAVLDLGGRDAESGDHLVTEGMIRGFYHCHRQMMGYV